MSLVSAKSSLTEPGGTGCSQASAGTDPVIHAPRQEGQKTP